MDQSLASALDRLLNKQNEILRKLNGAHQDLINLLLPEIDKHLHEQLPHNDTPR